MSTHLTILLVETENASQNIVYKQNNSIFKEKRVRVHTGDKWELCVKLVDGQKMMFETWSDCMVHEVKVKLIKIL